jgi:CheY-like chemotaxis protein
VAHIQLTKLLILLVNHSSVCEGLLLANMKKNSNNKDYNNKSLANQSNEDFKVDKDKPIAKLLIVDGDPDIVHVLKQGLLKKGFLVSAFTNPEEALQNFQSNSEDYCLMLSDIRMPEMSGIQLARKVREINPDVKIVLMTSFEIKDEEFSKVFPSMHVDGFVQKPIGISDLTNKILSIMGEVKRGID